MARKPKAAPKAADPVSDKDVVENPDFVPAPTPKVVKWKQPLPAPVLDDHGNDLVLVEIIPLVDIIINGRKLPAGVKTVLPASVAHNFASVIKGV